MTVRILTGDCRQRLRDLPEESVHCVVTSPPYWGLRDYGIGGQVGLEETADAYIATLVDVFREVWRVLRQDGTIWLNLGDSYAGSWGAQAKRETPGEISRNSVRNHPKRVRNTGSIRQAGLKPKDLIGIPWRVAFALQADGWYLRSEIVWAKPNPMPESVTDRPTSAHEKVFLLTKSPRYFYDAEAIREAAAYAGPNAPDKIKSPHGQGYSRRAVNGDGRKRGVPPRHAQYDSSQRVGLDVVGRGFGRNARNVWEIASVPYREAHFATFPPALAERCIKAGSRPGDTVLDPFAGAGTTGLVADRLGRDAILIELNPEYASMAERRVRGDAGMLAQVEVG